MELPDHEIAGYTEKAPKRKKTKVKIVRKNGKYVVKKEVAPPGRKDQVKKLKKIKPKAKDGTKLNPYAIAWAQHKKHGKPD